MLWTMVVLFENNAISIFYIFCKQNDKNSYNGFMTSRLLLASLAILAIVASCSPAQDTTNSKSANQEQEIIIINQITWSDLLKQKEDNYLVFVYSEKCGHCHDMMNDIVAFANDDILPTYFVNTLQNNVPLSSETIVPTNKIEEATIIGTPTIIEVKENWIITNVAGIDNCLTLLNEKRMT